MSFGVSGCLSFDRSFEQQVGLLEAGVGRLVMSVIGIRVITYISVIRVIRVIRDLGFGIRVIRAIRGLQFARDRGVKCGV